MKLVMDGNILVSMSHEDDGFHLYFQEKNLLLPVDRIIPKRKEDFNPCPIVEVVMPKDITPVLFAASMLLYMTNEQLIQVTKEYLKWKK